MALIPSKIAPGSVGEWLKKTSKLVVRSIDASSRTLCALFCIPSVTREARILTSASVRYGIPAPIHVKSLESRGQSLDSWCGRHRNSLTCAQRGPRCTLDSEMNGRRQDDQCSKDEGKQHI